MKNPVSLLLVTVLLTGPLSKPNPYLNARSISGGQINIIPEKDSLSISAFQTTPAASVLSRKQIPILCYHQIRDWRPTDSKRAKDYIVPVDVFKKQMKMLADSGYHTILPDQLYSYLTKGTALPSKPIMLTFDDTDLDQWEIARPEMKKYGFKGVFFIMTVSLGRPHYMSKAQVKQLSDEGNVIESHTWDHHRVDRYKHDPNPK